MVYDVWLQGNLHLLKAVCKNECKCERLVTSIYYFVLEYKFYNHLSINDIILMTKTILSSQQYLGPETLPVHFLPQSVITFPVFFFNQHVCFIFLFQRPGPVPEFHVKASQSSFSWHFCWHSSALRIFLKRYFLPGFLTASPL